MTLKGVQIMKKHKYMEEIDEIGTRETGSEETPTKQKSTRRILKSFLILVLTALCVVGLILIKKVKLPHHLILYFYFTTTSKKCKWFSRRGSGRIDRMTYNYGFLY